ncbi:MAG TPA: GntG family PLP-dependent aldolase [Gaiellaceae bacterium]|nr:GntG family PLP-dependent aldolase [Gaiellaceae bacterium]
MSAVAAPPEPLVSFLDTSTEPTAAMRDAMRDARVGDDVYGRDPTVNELEARAESLLGKEAAVFVPTGTMANLVALLALTSRGDAVVLEEQSHIACAEAGGVAAVAGCMPLLVAGRRGVLRPEDVERVLLPPDEHRPPPTLLCLENTHNRAGGTVTTPAETAALRALCDERGLRLHLDGARLFNAAAALELEPAALAADVHTVSFCLSKGLGAPVGSVLAGSAETVARARRMRKLLGGGMRQAGVLAAAGLVALDGWRGRLLADHRRARALASRLAALPGLRVDADSVQTNIVFCEAADARGLASRLLERGIACSASSATRLRFVLHHQIGDGDVERLAAELAELLPA